MYLEFKACSEVKGGATINLLPLLSNKEKEFQHVYRHHRDPW